jgi:hypothetical protein
VFRKTVLLALVTGALAAFAAPAVAQANVALTDGEGNVIEPGTGITATSSNLVTTTASGTIACASVVLHFELEVNGPEHVVLGQIGAATTSNCVVKTPIGNFSINVTDWTVGSVTINTWGTGEASASFGADIPAFGLSCVFAGSVHPQATHPDILDVGPSTLAGSGTNCSPTTTIEGQFTIETSTGGEVTIDYEATP